MIKTLLRLTFYALPLIAFAANFTEPRAAVRVASTANLRAASAPIPMNVTIYRSHGAQFARVPQVTAVAPGLRAGRPSAQEVKAYVQTQAIERGVNPKLALWIVKHESSFNPRARGDGDASRGLWQISKVYHPEVSDVSAYSVKSSTQWSLERLREGKAYEWSTYRYCRTLYEDCPF